MKELSPYGARAIVHNIRLDSFAFSQRSNFTGVGMGVKVLLAEILRNELTARGVNSLAPSDYDQIVERLVEQLTELELSLAARQITDKNEP